MDRSRVVLAELQRERGNRGEVVALSTTDIPGRLESLQSANVRFLNGTDREVVIERVWQHGSAWVFKFAGVNTISEAEPFRNAELWVEPSGRAQLPAGEWFQSDFIGCELVDLGLGQTVGSIVGWQEYGGPALLVVDREGRELLIPFVSAFCRSVDAANRQVTVEYPSGMLAGLLALGEE
jgi:16S rRNA processing protein RimM